MPLSVVPVSLNYFISFPLFSVKRFSYRLKIHKQLKSFIFRVADELEGIFTYMTLGQTLTSLITFASCLFVATSVSFSNNIPDKNN